MFGSKTVGAVYDVLRGVNATVWRGVEGAEKAGKIVKTGISGADVVIGTSHALEDFGCQDYACGSLDAIGSIASAIGLALENISTTKHLTVVNGSVTVGCRSVRYYCKNYGTFWDCAIAAGEGVKKVVTFTVNR